MVDIDSPLQDPTSYTSDRQTRSRDAWLDQVLHCSCGCCGCLARHDRMIWMIHDSRIFKNHQLLKGTLRWIPKDVSPNRKDPSDSSTDTWPPQPKGWGWIHSTFWKVGKMFILHGGLHLHHSKRFGYDAWKPKRHFFGGITLPNHLAWPIGGLVVFYIVLLRWCITPKFNSENPLKSHGAPKRKDRLSRPTVFRAICWIFRACKYAGFQRPKMLFGS